jgi:hypothetical protein
VELVVKSRCRPLGVDITAGLESEKSATEDDGSGSADARRMGVAGEKRREILRSKGSKYCSG